MAVGTDIRIGPHFLKVRNVNKKNINALLPNFELNVKFA